MVSVNARRHPTLGAGGTVLVTGATGMVGSWLVKELLASGAHVVAFVLDCEAGSELVRSGDIDRVSVARGSLEDYWAIERAINLHQVETVFHLGAQTIVPAAQRSPLPTFEANIRGTYNLLEACRRVGTAVRRIVVASSDKAYGTAALPYHEGDALEGRNPYDVSKSCADLIAQAYHSTYGLPVVVVRCGNIYGGGDLNWSRIVPGTVRSFIRGERPLIRSDGTLVRDYLYVDDAVRAYIDVAEAPESAVVGEAFNFSTECATAVLEVVGTIAELMSAQSIEPKVLGVATGEIQEQRLSTDKARAVLGWKPAFDLETGLRHAIDWYRAVLAPEDGATSR